MFFIKAHLTSDFTAERQKPNSLVYYYDADTDATYWVTYDKILDDWTKGYLGENPEEASIFSWFDYRSRMFNDTPKRGLRIDHILISENLESFILNTGIDYSARAMEKPSDHCPVWIKLK